MDNAAVLTKPRKAPLGTLVLWPSHQDAAHSVPEVVIRWSAVHDVDEQHPWLILGSEGPQKLSHDSVRGCTILQIAAAEAVSIVASQQAT